MSIDVCLQEELHPFAQAMVDFLIECGNRSFRPALVRPLMRGTNAKYEADQQVMMNLVDESQKFVHRFMMHTDADYHSC